MRKAIERIHVTELEHDAIIDSLLSYEKAIKLWIQDTDRSLAELIEADNIYRTVQPLRKRLQIMRDASDA